MSIVAQDLGHPPLTSNNMTLMIQVFRNDNPPVFDKKIYTQSISQDFQVGQQVVNVKATDRDPQVSIITYSHQMCVYFYCSMHWNPMKNNNNDDNNGNINNYNNKNNDNNFDNNRNYNNNYNINNKIIIIELLLIIQ